MKLYKRLLIKNLWLVLSYYAFRLRLLIKNFIDWFLSY